MDGLKIITATPTSALHPARADVACFVGFVARRALPLPAPVRTWLEENHWGPRQTGKSEEEFAHLRDLPVPITSWETFDALFAWDERMIDAQPGTPRCDTVLGAAVRSFFVLGGRLCYVIRLGDPWPVRTLAAVRRAEATRYLPTFPPVEFVDRTTWRGLGHLFGLPGVSYLALPDLPDMFAVTSSPRASFTPAEGPETFIECATRVSPAEQRFLRGVPAPRCDENGFQAWRECVERFGAFLSDRRNRLREIQLIAAVPLPADAASVANEPDPAERVHRAARAQWREVAQIQTAFVQVVYPWLRTRDSGLLPGNLLAPDGWFVGLLAQNALEQGSWQSLIHRPAGAITAVEPVLDRATLTLALGAGAATVREHVSIIGPTARGLLVLSDVTTDDDPVYRPASVNRLVVAILRAARVAGDDLVFANNGEALWRRVRESLGNVLAGLWSQGALLGASAREAFEVRCDRSTMTQADIDAGRLIARVSFTAAAPIVEITVMLLMDDAGQVNIATSPAANNPQAA